MAEQNKNPSDRLN